MSFHKLGPKAGSYLRAAPLPHIFTILAFFAARCLSGLLLGSPACQGRLETTLLSCCLAFSLGVFFCSFTDGLCRYKEYKRFKKTFSRFGFRVRLLSINSRSRCQRDALLQAARENGIEKQVAAYFRLLGYRWYHILPDQILTNPRILFDPKFLRATFWPGLRM
ncbi:MAG: hypothetical protein K9K64_06470 [Desulfohalobiaceae bacterium]|nr:hypothetical protein [Desulfohalobiaceae bacterium]